MKPKQGPSQPQPPDWPESVLPGDRSGEGSEDLFRHIERDIQRKSGLPRGKPPERKNPD